MQALVFDKSKTDWDSSRGFEKVEVPEPSLGSGDDDMVIMKVHYAGVCGTDRGIWNRMAFKEQILNSIDEEIARSASDEAISTQKEAASTALAVSKPKPYRIIGHEFFGEITQVGKNVKDFKPGDM